MSKSELKEMLKKLGKDYSEEALNELIDAADENGDGEIDFEEFLNVNKKQMQQSVKERPTIKKRKKTAPDSDVS